MVPLSKNTNPDPLPRLCLLRGSGFVVLWPGPALPPPKGVEEELVCGMLPALSRYDDTSLRSYSGWIVRPSQQPSSRLGCPTAGLATLCDTFRQPKPLPRLRLLRGFGHDPQAGLAVRNAGLASPQKRTHAKPLPRLCLLRGLACRSSSRIGCPSSDKRLCEAES